MKDSFRDRIAFCKAYVFLVAYLTVLGWALSSIHHLRWIGLLSLPGLVAVFLMFQQWKEPGNSFWRSVGRPLAYWPLLLLAALMLLGQLLYPPTMLDSLTYRLPRLFLWLQNDSLQHMLTAEPRLNYMPQTWGLATLPLVQLAGDQLVWCWTFASWIILYLLAFDWAREAGADEKKSKLLAFLASTSMFAVLQACSSANDLFGAVAVLLALRFVMNFERSRNWWDISWAVTSFGIAASTKPHYSVFGLPLVLWFFFSPSRPWRAFRWGWLPVLAVVWLLCSPVPTFVLNCQTYGNWAGTAQDASLKGKSPVWNVLLGLSLLAWQNPQPPINPLATASVNQRLDQAVSDWGINRLEPRFGLRMALITTVDGAALGLVTSVLFCAGIFLALRRPPPAWRSWQMAAGAAGLLCIVLALSQFVPGGVGRAYCGFLYFTLPLALVGWSRMRSWTLKCAMYLSLFSGLTVVILNPSHPLWPDHWVQQKLAHSPRFHHLAEQMNPYLEFSRRADTGESLMQQIPSDEHQVVVLVGDDRPLLPLFRPYLKRQMLFLPPHATPKELNQLGARYVVVGGGAEVEYPELCDYLAKSGDYDLVMKRDYTSKLARGPEPWMLFCRHTGTNRPAAH
jgi:hypothetical protein